MSAFEHQQMKANMRKIIRFLSVVAVFAGGAVAQAQVYVEASVTALTVKKSVNGIHYEAKPSIFSGLMGYQINPNLAVEGYAGMGAGNAVMTENRINYGEKFKVDASYGVFVKPRIAISNNMELFARLGYLENKSSHSNSNNMMVRETQSTLALGGGANYYFDSYTYLTVGYMGYNNKSSFKINGLNFGVGYKF